MIPIRDENPTTHRPLLTALLIAANLGVFLLLEPLGASKAQQAEYFACHAAIPYEVTHGTTLVSAARAGRIADPAARAYAMLEARGCPGKSVWGSILLSMFLHGGLLHIAGNMLYLWVFGNNVEDRLGIPKFALFYLASGFAATYAQSYASPSSGIPLIGASGAIAGVLGAYLVMFPRARVTNLVIFFFITMIELPASVVLGMWFVLQLFQSIGSVTGQGGVAFMAHVAGFAAGMLLVLILRPRREPRRPAY